MNRSRFLKGFSASAVIGLLLAILGCTASDVPPLGQVRGKVTLDGKPVVGAKVVFQPEKGRASSGTTDAEGNYELWYTVDLKGAKVGTCLVQVYTGEKEESEEPEETEKKAGDGTDGTPQPQLEPTIVPEKYGELSPLSFEVKKGENVFDIELSSK